MDSDSTLDGSIELKVLTTKGNALYFRICENCFRNGRLVRYPGTEVLGRRARDYALQPCFICRKDAESGEQHMISSMGPRP